MRRPLGLQSLFCASFCAPTSATNKRISRGRVRPPGNRAECRWPRKGSPPLDSPSRVGFLGPCFCEQVPSSWCRFWCRLGFRIASLWCVALRGANATNVHEHERFSLLCVSVRNAANYQIWTLSPLRLPFRHPGVVNVTLYDKMISCNTATSPS